MRPVGSLHMLLCVLATTTLLGCAPSAPQAAGEVAASTPDVAPTGVPSASRSDSTTLSTEVRSFEQQIVDVHSDMVWVLQHMTALEPERQKRLGAMMADLMAQESSLLSSMQPVADSMTQEERSASSFQIGRIVANIQDMRQLAAEAPDPTKIPKLAPGDVGTIGEMGRQMGELHDEMLANSERMSIVQVEAIAANMVDLTGNLDRLKIPIGSGYGRLSPEQRHELERRLEAMRQITQQMVKVAS